MEDESLIVYMHACVHVLRIESCIFISDFCSLLQAWCGTGCGATQHWLVSDK